MKKKKSGQQQLKQTMLSSSWLIHKNTSYLNKPELKTGSNDVIASKTLPTDIQGRDSVRQKPHINKFLSLLRSIQKYSFFFCNCIPRRCGQYISGGTDSHEPRSSLHTRIIVSSSSLLTSFSSGRLRLKAFGALMPPKLPPDAECAVTHLCIN